MELIGMLSGVSQDILSGKATVSFEVEDTKRVAAEASSLSGIRLRIEAKKYRKKRSLDANAYYWQLITKLASCLQISNPAAHNLMLRRYGQMECIDGKLIYLVLPNTDEAEERAIEAENYHIKPTSEIRTGSDGELYRTYIMLRGSSTYDSKEMSRLIDGLVSECKEVGIETLPPEEVDRMIEAYRRSRKEKTDE